MKILIEQQVDQQGTLIPDAYVIKEISDTYRILKGYYGDRQGGVGSLIDAADVDALISAGYHVTITLPPTFKAPIPVATQGGKSE